MEAAEDGVWADTAVTADPDITTVITHLNSQ
jgi:hypothetical protein